MDVHVAGYDYLPAPSSVTRAPVGPGRQGEMRQPTTFGRMAGEAYRYVPAIRAADLHRRLAKEHNLLVIDVRDAADIAESGTVPGAANISLGTLSYAADNQVPEDWRDPRLADRTRPIITTCILGPLGAIGGKLLHDMGFSDVQLLEGGVQAWIDAGLPVSANGG